MTICWKLPSKMLINESTHLKFFNDGPFEPIYFSCLDWCVVSWFCNNLMLPNCLFTLRLALANGKGNYWLGLHEHKISPYWFQIMADGCWHSLMQQSWWSEILQMHNDLGIKWPSLRVWIRSGYQFVWYFNSYCAEFILGNLKVYLDFL